MWHALAHYLGLDNGSGGWYLFWSGFGSDLGEAAIIGGLIQLYRKHNCHQKGCWRMGRHPIGPYVVCRKHHPAIPSGGATADDIVAAHQASLS